MTSKDLILVLTILFSLNGLALSQTIENPIAEIKQGSAIESKSTIVSVQEEESNSLGLIYSAKKIEEAKILLQEKNPAEAEKILKDLKEWLTTATELHYNLYKILSDKQNKTIESKFEKAHALDFGKLRDESCFWLAKTYILQNKPKDAISILVEIIKSQIGQPLGEQSYKLLQEIKFSDKVP